MAAPATRLTFKDEAATLRMSILTLVDRDVEATLAVRGSQLLRDLRARALDDVTVDGVSSVGTSPVA
jgi:hypothetical protein